MPVVNGRNVGFAQAANAAVNVAGRVIDLAPGANVLSDVLENPAMTRLTYYILQDAGAAFGFLVFPQVAFRRQQTNALTFVDVGPGVLTVPGVPTVITINVLTVEAMRLYISSTAPGGGGNLNGLYVLSASG
jgi:hypothetical protein